MGESRQSFGDLNREARAELPKNSYEKAFMLFSRLILPYVAKGVDTDKPFTDDMEIAALLCLAEAQRKRRGLFGVPIEKL